jgi:xanthine dehydrogenase accessory factor
VKDVLPTLERWVGEGLRAAVATVVDRKGSAPRDVGASLALNERGEIAGSVTGGCVEPAVIGEAQEVLAGAAARVVTYGIADDEAFDVGLACGGTVAILVHELDPGVVAPLAAAVADDRAVSLRVRLADGAQEVGAAAETGLEQAPDGLVFVEGFAPRPALYVFGAVDHAAALVAVGRFLGYRVTVCDARGAFVTRERFPDADELVVDWPDRFLARAPVDERTAICVLTHDQKFDVPVLKAALATPARYVGAMGSVVAVADRCERLRAEGVGDGELARIHQPIGLAIGARSPEEVAIAVAAELVQASAQSRRGGSTLIDAPNRS